jgi:glutamyl-tRNA reductase
MKIIAAGLNHRTAPVKVREKLAFESDQYINALETLKKSYPDAEFVLLSTCNRVELYSVSEASGGVTIEAIADFLSEFHGFHRKNFLELMYVYQDEQAVRHLLTVAGGLDSMVVGEEQILSQVKDSYRQACNAKTTGKVLHRLFHCAFATSKRIHTETSISDGRISVAGVAIGLAKQLVVNISTAKTTVIGAGEMGQLLIKHLSHLGCSDITVINRSYEHALQAARSFGIKAMKWNKLPDALAKADIVIASASVQNYLFDKSYVKKIMAKRHEKPLLIIDIAVPRNFEPQVSEIKNVKIFSIDQLSAAAEENKDIRQEDISACMQIICESTEEFMDWFHARDIGPLIGRMKEQFSQISRNELERFFVGTRQEAACKEVLEMMIDRVVGKLLHCVIRNVDNIAKQNGPTEAAKLVKSIVEYAEKISSQPGSKEDIKL